MAAAKKKAVKRAAKKSAPEKTAAKKAASKKFRIAPRDEQVPVNLLTPYEKRFGKNPRIHDEKDIGELKHAIVNFGFIEPLLISEDNVVLSGNGRLQAVKELGWKKVRCLRAFGMTEEQKRLVGLNANAISKRARDDKDALVYQLSVALAADFDPQVLLDLGWEESALQSAKGVAEASDQLEKWHRDFGIPAEEQPPAPPEKGYGGFSQEGSFVIRAQSLNQGAASPTPLPYHGGKTKLLPYLLPIVESVDASFFLEVFCGGAALLWGLNAPFEVEVLNDRMGAVTAFWETMKTDFDSFSALAHKRGLHSSDYYLHAQAVMSGKVKAESKVELAWALWYSSVNSHAHTGTGGFLVGREDNKAEVFSARLAKMTGERMKRLESVTILNRDAVDLVNVHGKDARSFIYADPPYFDTCMGHYVGYTQEDFVRLLDALAGAACRWVLSSFPSELLEEYREKHGWKQVRLTTRKLAHPSSVNDTGDKVEVITCNFTPNFRTD